MGRDRQMSEAIGAVHRFRDETFVAGWADRFVPVGERLALFDIVLAELESRVPADACVVDLGIVPGPIDAIVSTWTLHDLGSPRNVELVYERCARVLGNGWAAPVSGAQIAWRCSRRKSNLRPRRRTMYA